MTDTPPRRYGLHGTDGLHALRATDGLHALRATDELRGLHGLAGDWDCENDD